MDDRTYLLKEIHACQRKLLLARVFSYSLRGLAAGGIAAACLEFAAVFVPFYAVHQFACAALLAGVLCGCFLAWRRRPDRKAAAHCLDGFGLQERVLTAYENREKDTAIAVRQRADAAQCLKKQRDRIRIRIRPKVKEAAASVLALCLIAVLAMVPSQAKKDAAERHAVAVEAKELAKELADVQEQLKKTDTDILSEEQREELQQLQESLARSEEELKQADSAKELETAKQTLAYKYEQAAAYTGTELLAKEAADSLQNGSETGTESADGKGSESVSGKNTDGSDGSTGNGGNGSGKANASGNGDGSESGSGNGNGNDSGSGDGNGSGSGDGNGNGSGSGDGNGSGSGNGNGTGSGSGRGTGSSQTGHDYVSVPNALGDDESIASQKGDSDDSDYEKAQNGLAWTGDHVSLDSVIGSYTKKAYEGLESGKYPSGMEDVIRTYFESLN